MNRRQFTASLAALAATPALPLAARVPAAAPAVPPGAYAWAQLIARSQNQCSPQMLAKALHLKPGVAKVLFKDMVVDGVLQMPGTTGVARAVKPFETTGLERTATDRLKAKAKEVLQDAFGPQEHSDAQSPLVNPDTQGLGCAETAPEDTADASPDQPPQESPAKG